MSDTVNKISNVTTNRSVSGISSLSDRQFSVVWDVDARAAKEGRSKTLGKVVDIREARCDNGDTLPNANGLCPAGSNLIFKKVSTEDQAILLSSDEFQQANNQVLKDTLKGAGGIQPAITKEEWQEYKGEGVADYNQIQTSDSSSSAQVEEAELDHLPEVAAESTTPEGGGLTNLFQDLIKTAGGVPVATQQAQVLGVKGVVSLQFPKKAVYTGTDAQDSFKISQFVYKAPQEDLFRKDTDIIDTISKNGLKRNSNLKELIGSVRLPIPNNLQDKMDVGYDGASANALSMGAFMSAFQSAMNANNAFDILKDTATGGLDIINKLGNLPPALKMQLSAVVAKTLLSKVNVNVDPNQAIARATGAVINPNLELLFSGPSLRAFQFSFNLSPSGADDADEIRKIIRFFKQGMVPKKMGGTTQGFMIGTPNVFRLQYLTGSSRIKSMNAFKICALTSANFDYAPTGQYAAYGDSLARSQPVNTIMTLTFQELTPIFDADYSKDGGSDPSVKDGLGTGNSITAGGDVGF